MDTERVYDWEEVHEGGREGLRPWMCVCMYVCFSLERNRASARVRREKKKSMVETYEGEVSKLENSLNLLKMHTFGSGQAQDLSSALGADAVWPV